MNFKEIVNSDKPVLVDFFAEWCGPCKMMKPVLEDLKRIMGDKVSIIKIDIDKNQALARQYQVQSVPTLMIFQKGELKWRQAGAMQANQLKSMLDKYIS